MRLFRLLLLLLWAAPALGQPTAPVNRNASPEARALLAYLHQIDEQYTLSGQHNYGGEPTRYTDTAREITGKEPAIWGSDFLWAGPEDPGPQVVAEALRQHRAGSIITLMWHVGRPMDAPPYRWRESVQAELTAAEWKELTTPGTPLHARWLAQVDGVAEHLKQLRDAHVPVLWRPYHEMNGVWFWWGDKKGAAGYQKLWRMLFDRMTRRHGLNNLLWVWNANGPRDLPQDEAFAYRHYYPGHAYVDVLATDVYNMDYEQKDYHELLKLAGPKLMALGEVGQLPRPAFLEAQPRWAWFMVWANWLTTHNRPEDVRTIYEHPTVLTRDELKLPR